MSLEEIDRKGELDANAANQAAKVAYDQAYYQTLLEAGKASLERARSAAELVQKAAAAIGTLYAGVLGVSFSVADRRFPLRGIIPALFLGLAIALSMVYAAYITRPGEVALQDLSTSPPERLQGRLVNFFAIITDAVQRRSTWLRASVVSLGLGVFFLPTAFVTFGNSGQPDRSKLTPWPTPPVAATDRAASLAGPVFKAQVDEVSSLRRAQLDQTETALWLWGLLTVGGVVLVVIVPRVLR